MTVMIVLRTVFNSVMKIKALSRYIETGFFCFGAYLFEIGEPQRQ